MKIAIASSGLGHVARGIETWAEDSAIALSQLSSCQVAELLSKSRGTDQAESGAASGGRSLNTIEVTLFKGSGKVSRPYERVIWCLRRGSRLNRVVAAIFSRLGGWRYGLGSEYEVEQTTFALGLIRALHEGAFDIVHLQDPLLAWHLEKARQKGRHFARVILAHGTEESVEFLQRFECVQHLAPWHLQEALRALNQESICLAPSRQGAKRR